MNISQFELCYGDVLAKEKEMQADQESKKLTPSTTSEPVIHATNASIQQTTPKVVESKEKMISSQKIYLPALLIAIFILVVAMFQIPPVLYYTDPPASDDFPLDGVNLESCTVSLENNTVFTIIVTWSDNKGLIAFQIIWL